MCSIKSQKRLVKKSLDKKTSAINVRVVVIIGKTSETIIFLRRITNRL
jgi:phosphopantothenoylcysteine synthetase/decarboxylase